MDNRIPLARGLGSSAAATVGGVVAGNALGGGTLPMSTLLRLATEIETHPDNASAVLLGGFVVSAHLGERVEAVRFDVPDGLRAVLFIPERRLSTADMRRVLPLEVPLRDAVSNLGRVAIGVAGIASGRFELLADLTVDRIHEPYRSVAYPQLPRLTGAARAAGALGAFLSGAGSTVLAFVAPGADPAPVEAALREAAEAESLDGRLAVVRPRNAGPEIVEGP
jgi:homoserine kinase